jgi:putative nucleotidyltransferase with HDIG domain
MHKIELPRQSLEVSLSLSEQWLKLLYARSYLYEGLVYQDFLKAAVEITQSKIGYFHLFCEEKDTIKLAVWSDAVLPICTTTHANHYPVREAGIWADSIRLRRPVIHNDYPRQCSPNGLPQGHFPISRHLSVPVFNQDEIVAILGVGNSDQPYAQSLGEELMKFVQQGYAIVQQKVAEIQSHRHSRLELAQTDTISLLVKMVSCLTGAASLRDEYTSRHSQNVAELAVNIGRQMGLGEDAILGLRLGSLVHDIGKIAIPSEILTKPRQLNPAEYELIKTHVERGAEIFASIDFPWPILEMISQHHERLDGSGYPYGLRSEAIVLEARIIAVADVFDSMASHRPYRYAPGIHKAIDELKKGRAVLYDSYVVDALLRFLEEADESFWRLYPKMSSHDHSDHTSS